MGPPPGAGTVPSGQLHAPFSGTRGAVHVGAVTPGHIAVPYPLNAGSDPSGHSQRVVCQRSGAVQLGRSGGGMMVSARAFDAEDSAARASAAMIDFMGATPFERARGYPWGY